MNRIWLSWFFLGMASVCIAQTITITDHETGDPIELVSLTSESPPAFTTTNAKGQADISAFRDAARIEVRMLGYQPLVSSFAELDSLEFQLELIPSTIGLEGVVVAATRWSQHPSGIPFQITSVTAKEVNLQNPQTAADLLGISGKVFIQKSQQGGGSPMIRGFATNRLLYTVDGVRMNTAIFRSGNIQNVINIDPFATQKTEVLFGPGSVIYGSDAIGGVMNFQTLTPQLSVSEEKLIIGKANLRFASANHEKAGHFDLNAGWKKWAMVSSFSYWDFGDLRMGSYGPDEYLRPFYVQRQDSADVLIANDDPKVQRPSAYSQINMMQKLRFKPNKNWDFQYGFHFSETSEYSRYDRHIRYRNGMPRYGEWSYGPQKWLMNNLNVFHKGNSGLYNQMTIRLAQQVFEESRIDRDINHPERHIRSEKVDAYSVNLDLKKAVGKNLEFFYGLEAVRNDVNSTGTDEDIETGETMPGPSRYPQSTSSTYAAYLSGQFDLSEKAVLHVGVRYSRFLLDANFDTTFYDFPFTTAKINDGAISGSLGLVYRPSEDWVVNVVGSTGFRAPNVDDLGKVFDSEPGAVTVPNPGLEAEYAYNAEIGIAKVFGKTVKIDLTAFHTWLQNAMVRRDYTLNGRDSIIYDGTLSRVQAIQNAAFATVFGIQAGVEIKLPGGFGFTSDFNYQAGEEQLDNGETSPARHAAPWFGTSRLTYVSGRLNLQFYAVYSGAVKFENMPEEEKGKPEIYAIDENGNPWSPGWYTLNFKAMHKISDAISVSAGLENLTDCRYRPYSSGIVAPGRNFILSFRTVF